MKNKSRRVYSICEGHAEKRVVIKWAFSRFGKQRDEHIETEFGKQMVLGKQMLYNEWSPLPSKFKSAAAMAAQRKANMERRVKRRDPLFAEQMINEHLKKEKFTQNACQRDLEFKIQIDKEWIEKWWQQHPPEKQVVF